MTALLLFGLQSRERHPELTGRFLCQNGGLATGTQRFKTRAYRRPAVPPSCSSCLTRHAYSCSALNLGSRFAKSLPFACDQQVQWWQWQESFRLVRAALLMSMAAFVGSHGNLCTLRCNHLLSSNFGRSLQSGISKPESSAC